MAPLPLGGPYEKNHGYNNGSYPVGTYDAHELPKVSIIVLCRSWVELRGEQGQLRAGASGVGRGLQRPRLPLFVELVMVLVRRGGGLSSRSFISSIKAEVKTLYSIIRKQVCFTRMIRPIFPLHFFSFHFISCPLLFHHERQTKLLQLSDDPYAYTRYLPA